MVEKIKLSRAAKEIIKNNKLEIERLTKELEEQRELKEHLRQSRSKYMKECQELRQAAKEKDMYKYAFSVCLAAVDERRLAWSMAEEYKRQKDIYDDKRETKNYISDMFKEDLEGAKKEATKVDEEIKGIAKDLGLNLDDIFKKFGLNKK